VRVLGKIWLIAVVTPRIVKPMFKAEPAVKPGGIAPDARHIETVRSNDGQGYLPAAVPKRFLAHQSQQQNAGPLRPHNRRGRTSGHLHDVEPSSRKKRVKHVSDDMPVGVLYYFHVRTGGNAARSVTHAIGVVSEKPVRNGE
jgi:hypothetical protein